MFTNFYEFCKLAYGYTDAEIEKLKANDEEVRQAAECVVRIIKSSRMTSIEKQMAIWQILH
jgi:hypothetical protein